MKICCDCARIASKNASSLKGPISFKSLGPTQSRRIAATVELIGYLIYTSLDKSHGSVNFFFTILLILGLDHLLEVVASDREAVPAVPSLAKKLYP